MKIILNLEEGRLLEEARRALFLWAIEKYEGDELRVAYALGINIATLRANGAKYDVSSLLVSRRRGAPMDYKRHSEVLRLSSSGLTVGGIAKAMGVSRQRIDQMIQNMIRHKTKADVDKGNN